MTKYNVVDFKDREPIPDAQGFKHPQYPAEVASGKSQTGTALDFGIPTQKKTRRRLLTCSSRSVKRSAPKLNCACKIQGGIAGVS